MKTIEYVKKVGHVHTIFYGDLEETWTSYVACRSTRHAARLIRRLNWYRQEGYPGGFFRHTKYDAKKGKVITHAGYDI